MGCTTKHVIAVLLLGLGFLSVASPAQAEGSATEKAPLLLGQGEQRLLHVPGLTRYSLGSDVARVHPLPAASAKAQSESILIKGVKPGLGDLWIWTRDGSTEHRSIQVEKWEQDPAQAALNRALSILQETEIIFAGSGAVLRGEVHSLAEAARVHAILTQFPQAVHDETELSDELLGEGRARLEAWLKGSPYSKRLRIEQNGKVLFVRGSLERPEERTSVAKQVTALFPPAQLDVEALPDAAPTIHFKVFLLELKRSEFHSFGLSWPAGQDGALEITSWGLQESLKLDVALKAAEGDGSLKILSNPELVVRAPGEAELFSGGEIPIKTEAHFYSNVTWKNYGLTLKLKVDQVAGDRVRLEIFTEVSHLDETASDDQIPGIQSNRMKTQVDARFGTPLFLSGLLQDNLREQARGLPLLRRLPVLGALFGSDDYLNERSELVAILVPNAAPPRAPMEQIERATPKGYMPPPRNWISPERERELRASPDFPWNAFEPELAK